MKTTKSTETKPNAMIKKKENAIMENSKNAYEETTANKKVDFMERVEGTADNTNNTGNLIETVNTKKTNTAKFLSNGAYGCVYENLSTPELMTFRDETIQSVMQSLKCVASPDAPPQDVFEKKHTHTIDKIQFIELFSPSTGEKEEDFTEHRIVKETLYGETIRSIPNYYMYFAPILSSCPIDIAVLNAQDKMKCELFRETSTLSSSSLKKEKMKRLYVNSKVKFVEGTAPSNYFKKILWSDLPYKDGETVGQLSSFFVTRFIRSYRHLLKAVRLLQSGSSPNSIIIHHDLKDGNIIYDTKRGVPVIIDFGISFDKSVFDESTHPKKLGDVFYRYFNKYAPWSLDVVFMSYVAKVALLKNGEGDDSIKETYEKGAIAVDELKKVCDDFLENNEVLRWVDTLTGSNSTTSTTADSVTTTADSVTSTTDYLTNTVTKLLMKENIDQKKINIEVAKGGTLQSDSLNEVAGEMPVDDSMQNKMRKSPEQTAQTMSGFSGMKRNKMKTQWYAYIESFNGKVWKDLVMDLSKRYALWDVYSLSVCYLQYINQFELLNGKYQVPNMFMDFVEELKMVFDKT